MARKPREDVPEPRLTNAVAKKSAKRAPGKGARRAASAKKLGAVAGAFASFRPADEVYVPVEAVPTIFVQFDWASGIGGWPTRRFCVVHGPSGGGKTSFAKGIGRSFLERSHFVDDVDAERTTPIDFARLLIGDELFARASRERRFFACHPDSYEEVIDRQRSFCTSLREVAKRDPSVRGLTIIDSLRKLIPKDRLKLVLEESRAKREEHAGRDRGGQIQAKINAAWMDDVTILLEKSGAALLAIGREMENPEASVWDRKAGWAFKLGGGQAVFFESSLVMRVERAGFVYESGGAKDDDGGFVKRKCYGERHKFTIYKTKVSGHEDRKTVGFFHTSNGVLVPAGFDRARDVIDLGKRFGVVEASGSWLAFGATKLGQGEDRAVSRLTREPDLLAKVEAELRSRFDREDAGAPTPVSFDSETGEVDE